MEKTAALVVGANGATGRWLVRHLLDRGLAVRAIFAPGQTSRINVGHFMADLITRDDTWARWKGQMPVIYNP